MQDRSNLLTEQRLPESTNLDQMELADAVELMNRQDAAAVRAVGAEQGQIVRAVEMVVQCLSRGGRLFYVGAGTSGRLGVLDASECPPTFRSDPDMVQAIIAGGNEAVFRAMEGAEDRRDEGADAIAERNIGSRDLVLGIAAGGTTPFVHGALDAARHRGAATIFLTCVRELDREPHVDLIIRPLVGPEVVTGSTRLKAGTATKLVLNTISTLTMVQLGKVYGNLMVDLRATNEKLRDRAARIVSIITGLSRPQAMELVQQADGHVKPAILMHQRHLDAAGARGILDRCGGSLRDALEEHAVSAVAGKAEGLSERSGPALSARA